MNTSPENLNKRKRWLSLWHELHAVRFQALPTEAEVDQVLASLPPRLPNEKLADWLARAKRPAMASILSFPRYRFTKLTEIKLKAAAGPEQYSLPEQAIETPDQVFRLTVSKVENGLLVHIETLGSAIETYAGCLIGISDSDEPRHFVEAQLDAEGEYVGTLADSEDNRKALCVNPKFFLLEPNDA